MASFTVSILATMAEAFAAASGSPDSTDSTESCVMAAKLVLRSPELRSECETSKIACATALEAMVILAVVSPSTKEQLACMIVNTVCWALNRCSAMACSFESALIMPATGS